MNKCKVETCKNKVVAKGFCSKHYSQYRRHGEIHKYSCRDKFNHIEIFEDHAEIYLINNKNEVCAKALIDIEDIEKVKDIKWHRTELQRYTYYCKSNHSKWKSIHRLILGVDDENLVVDHINKDGLDNRKSNLRVCTNAQNLCNCKIPKNNKSGIKGVYWSNSRNKWAAQLTINNKTKLIGRFNTFEEAVKARLEAEEKYYGEYANGNCENM